MIGWYIGDAIGLFVVVPVVIFFLNRLLRPAMEINSYADDILAHGVALTGTLDAIPKLAETRQLTASARQGVASYGAALQRLL